MDRRRTRRDWRRGVHAQGGQRQSVNRGMMKVTFRAPAEILSFYDQYMRQVVEEGEYAVEVGSSSEDVRPSGELYVTRTLVIGERKRFFSETAIE
ncbi:MAG: fibronectin type III-like domain-contianing protein [Thermoprotei archaeon]